MGLFDFLKPKNKAGNSNKPQKAPIEPNAQHGFSLKLSDLETKTHSANVISVTVSPDFYELFPEAGRPTSTGGKREIKTSVVHLIFWERPVEVSFDFDVVSGGSEAFISKVNDQLNWLMTHKHVVDEVIVRDLLPLKNENWLDDGESAVNGERLIAAIRLSSIAFDEKAGMNLYYDDGNTFFGHTIIVDITSKQKIKEASIAG